MPSTLRVTLLSAAAWCLGRALCFEVSQVQYHFWFENKLHPDWILDQYDSVTFLKCLQLCRGASGCDGLALGPLRHTREMSPERRCVLLTGVNEAMCDDDQCDDGEVQVYLPSRKPATTTTTDQPTTTLAVTTSTTSSTTTTTDHPTTTTLAVTTSTTSPTTTTTTDHPTTTALEETTTSTISQTTTTTDHPTTAAIEETTSTITTVDESTTTTSAISTSTEVTERFVYELICVWEEDVLSFFKTDDYFFKENSGNGTCDTQPDHPYTDEYKHERFNANQEAACDEDFVIFKMNFTVINGKIAHIDVRCQEVRYEYLDRNATLSSRNNGSVVDCGRNHALTHIKPVEREFDDGNTYYDFEIVCQHVHLVVDSFLFGGVCVEDEEIVFSLVTNDYFFKEESGGFFCIAVNGDESPYADEKKEDFVMGAEELACDDDFILTGLSVQTLDHKIDYAWFECTRLRDQYLDRSEPLKSVRNDGGTVDCGQDHGLVSLNPTEKKFEDGTTYYDYEVTCRHILKPGR